MAEDLLPRLERSNLRQQAKHIIRLSITTGRTPPGEIFSASSLARQLGVSATPVREALLDLVNDGLLEVIRNRGFRAPILTRREVADLLEVRAMLEVPAIRQVTDLIRHDELRRAREHAFETTRAASARDTTAFIEADVLFHQTILEPLENRKLAGEIGRLRDQTRLYSLREQTPESDLLRLSAFEHVQLVEALDRRDRAAAESIMRKHLEWISRSDVNDSEEMHVLTELSAHEGRS
jgi:DNA-binding GntR family transcriptional regulator